MNDGLVLDELKRAIAELTVPINSQYPRPWMTVLADPSSATVFTVGKNQRNGYDAETVGSHTHYLDCLFNRGPESCRQLYDRVVGAPSPTRRNTDALVSMLRKHDVSAVLETNVICYSTPMSADLRKLVHEGGAKRGEEIFSAIYALIRPKVIISHGTDTAKRLGRYLGNELPTPPVELSDPVERVVGETTIFCDT